MKRGQPRSPKLSYTALILSLCPLSILAATERVSVATDGTQANRFGVGYQSSAISADGRFVAFESLSDNLVPGDTNLAYDVFVHDRQTQTTERVSVDSAGGQGNNSSFMPSISADGRFVAFASISDNLVPGDTNSSEVFVHDRETGVTERVALAPDGTEGDGYSFMPSLSADGRFVAFRSESTNLVPGDTNGVNDVFVRDRERGTIDRVSVSSDGAQGNGGSFDPTISADGRWVVFVSAATNLTPGIPPGEFQAQVFLRDLALGTTTLVSAAPNGAGADTGADAGVISADGRFVAYQSSASNLLPGVVGLGQKVYVWDRDTGKTEIVRSQDGGPADYSGHPSLSADGRFIAFQSGADNLVPGDTNGFSDIFLHDRVAGTLALISVDSTGAQGDSDSEDPVIDGSGDTVAFTSEAWNLVPGDTNGVRDTFVWTGGSLLVPQPPLLRSGRDFDGDGKPDLAVLKGNSATGARITIKDHTGRWIAEIPFSDGVVPVTFQTMDDFAGSASPELAILGSNGAVEVRDGTSGESIGSAALDPSLLPVDMEPLDDRNGNGSPDLAILGTRPDGSARVELRDGGDGTLIRDLTFHPSLRPVDLISTTDLTGDGRREIALLGKNRDPSKSDRLEVRDPANGALLATLWSGKGFRLQEAHEIGDLTGDGTHEIAVLRTKPDAVNVSLFDPATGAAVRGIGFAPHLMPLALVSVADIDGNGAPEVGVLARDPDSGAQRLVLHDGLTKRRTSTIWYNPDFAVQAVDVLPDLNGNGAEELAVLARRAADSQLKVFIKDSASGVLIRTIDF